MDQHYFNYLLNMFQLDYKPIDIEDCPICLEPIERIYTMINTPGETSKIHPVCIENWLKTSKNGILVQKPIESITIYDTDYKLCSITVHVKEQEISKVEINNGQDLYHYGCTCTLL